MNNYVILTDSSADLTEALYKECDIELLPLTFLLDGKSYQNLPDESTMRFSDFYAQLRDGKNVTTSAINVALFRETFEPFLKDGKDILYLGFSSGLSGTFSAGHIAAQELLEEYPDRKILCVDTLCASLGQGMLVYLTAKKRLQGATLEEAAAYAEETKLNMVHWFTVDDLFFLKRGGRISAATALVGISFLGDCYESVVPVHVVGCYTISAICVIVTANSAVMLHMPCSIPTLSRKIIIIKFG